MKRLQSALEWWREEEKKNPTCDIILKRFIFIPLSFQIDSIERTNELRTSINKFHFTIMFARLFDWMANIGTKMAKKSIYAALNLTRIAVCSVNLFTTTSFVNKLNWNVYSQNVHSSHSYSTYHNSFVMSNNDVFVFIFFCLFTNKQKIDWYSNMVRISELQDVMLSMTYNPANICININNSKLMCCYCVS